VELRIDERFAAIGIETSGRLIDLHATTARWGASVGHLPEELLASSLAGTVGFCPTNFGWQRGAFLVDRGELVTVREDRSLGGQFLVIGRERAGWTAHTIDPRELVNAYAATQTGQTKNPTHNHAVLDALWQQFGGATIHVLADGAVTLARIWEAAWVEAGAEQRFTPAHLVALDRDALRALYQDPGFVPSLDLDGIGAVLQPVKPRVKSARARRSRARPAGAHRTGLSR